MRTFAFVPKTKKWDKVKRPFCPTLFQTIVNSINLWRGKMKRVIGVFDSYEDGKMVINDLKAKGIPDGKISLVTRRRDANGVVLNEDYVEKGDEVVESPVAGATTGGISGGLAGVLAGIGALAIPGIGPVIAAGPIVAGLAGAAAGATGGGLLGALVGLGLEEEDGRIYSDELDKGGVVVSVEDDSIYTDKLILSITNIILETTKLGITKNKKNCF